MQTPHPPLSVHGVWGVVICQERNLGLPAQRVGRGRGLNSKATAQTLENLLFISYGVFGGHNMIIQQGRRVPLILGLLF